jgi:phenylpropionate dioxygenase-like ring-hydroxylating dioxygenase large terminal subunit
LFVRNSWYIALWADELKSTPVARRICDEAVVLFRENGRAAAIADRCCHRGTPLSLGEVTDEGLQCGYHGMVFDGTGKCVRIPGQVRVPQSAFVPSYSVIERDHFIWIWMGEAAQAEPSRIPDAAYHNDPQWPERHACLHIASSYLLMLDNLMDLTHLGYVHKRTIGGNPSQHVEATMETVATGSGLRYTRWMLNSPPPPTYVKAFGFAGRVDRWQEFTWIAPSNIVQWTGAKDVGTGAYEGNREGGFQFKVFHGLTPETATTCHYYFATANHWDPTNDAASDLFLHESYETFLEDKHIVEQQQARLSEFGEDWLVDIVSDATRIRMRRFLDHMLEQERRAAA